jgi:DNA-binding response OmpR family regulator
MNTRILIIEDDANLAYLIEDALAGDGYEVKCIGDGNLALEAFDAS